MMDFVSLALHYLISVIGGTSFDNLFSQFYTAEENFPLAPVHVSSDHDDSLQYHLEIYDFIIVGAGSAGCVLANRLSSQNYRVLLLEAGGNPFPLTIIPAMVYEMLQKPSIDWGFRSVPRENSGRAYNNNSHLINRGKGLGGSSMLNFNMYLRGSPYDFQDWARITGDEGWNYGNVLPFFKRIEDYHGIFFNDNFHGHYGPLPVETGKDVPLRKEWLAAGAEMGLMLRDPNGFQSEGVFPIDTTTFRGTSVSTYWAYLHPVLHRPNLRVVTYAHVQKIIFDKKNKAVAVNYKHKGRIYQACATKEIILSAGPISSPQLLLLSGIGPKEHLQSIGIPLKADLPVGKNLQDHYVTILGPFNVEEGKSVTSGRDYDSVALKNYLHNRTGAYGTVGFETGALLTSSLATNPNRPDIFLVYHAITADGTFASDFERRFGMQAGIMQKYVAGEDRKDSFFVEVILAKPQSSGEIKLASANPNDPPIIDPNFLNHTDDIKLLLEGIRKTIDLVTTTKSFAKIGAKLTTSHFPGCEDLSFGSDSYWECYARTIGLPFWDSIGTCRMGAGYEDPRAVVDSRLRVLGTAGLRVIDSSIMPEITTTSTLSPTLMIAEKGAQMILDYWNYHH